tara:strand:- start:291 stop:1013 length:723 start_codon:yes stop_codon:yes gene_type:complete
MSKIKLNAASGGGSVSLEAPTSTTGNANVEFKLPVADGTSGQALTTNASGQLAFATIADTNDYVKLQRVSGNTAVSQLNIDDLDVSTYKFFDFVGAICPVNDAVSIRFRFRTGGASGSDITGASYAHGFDVQYPDNNEQNESSTGNSKIIMSTGMGNDTGEGIFINARISFAESGDETQTRYLLNNITYFSHYLNNQGQPRFVNGAGALYQATTYPTGFNFHFANGNVASYSYCLYGMKR